jgi:hypothetical protein
LAAEICYQNWLPEAIGKLLLSERARIDYWNWLPDLAAGMGYQNWLPEAIEKLLLSERARIDYWNYWKKTLRRIKAVPHLTNLSLSG